MIFIFAITSILVLGLLPGADSGWKVKLTTHFHLVYVAVTTTSSIRHHGVELWFRYNFRYYPTRQHVAM
jgi:hypothetical protein